MFDRKKAQSIDCFCDECGKEVKAVLLEDFINIVEGKSEHSENEQRILLLMAFYSTIPDGMPGYQELARTVIREGWDKKPVSEMIKYYAPSTIYNYKQMKKLSIDYSPRKKASSSANYTF